MNLDPSTVSVDWRPAWRVIPTRYPEINLWRRVAAPAHEAAVAEIEQMTNPRNRMERGDLRLLRHQDHFPRRCSMDLKAPFAYRAAGRFNTRRFGAYYAAASLKTAVYERAHRTRRLLQEAGIGATKAEMRVIKARLRADLHDIRSMQSQRPELYRSDDYALSQSWAALLWEKGSQGVLYDSVRHTGGQCAAIYSPQTLAHCHKDRILIFDWNGSDTIAISQIKEFLKFKEGES